MDELNEHSLQGARESVRRATQIGERYETVSELGAGQYAVTRLAIRRDTGARCVVKSLPLRGIDDSKVIELFEREARVLERLRHPRIPRFLELLREATDEGEVLHLVQEYVEGEDLAQAIARGARFDEHDVKRIALELLAIAEYLHALTPPHIHRDIKPSNVILGMTGEVWLVDFGGARDKLMLDDAGESHGFTVVGTYGYMPYEQFEGRAVPASDLYAIGVTLLFLLSHREPADFDRRGMKIDFEGAVNVSPAFASVIGKLVEPAIEDRYSSATAVRRDIERGRMPRTRARRRRAALVSAAVAISVALGILITRPASDEPATWADGRAVPREPVAVAARVRETGVPPPIPDGELREVERSPVLLPEPSVPVSVRGSVRYDGRPITELTSVPPQFWLRNEATGKVATARARYQRGSFTLYGLAPGKYGVNLRFDAVAGNALGYPGDFYAWRIFDVTDGGVTEIDVDVVRIIHLTSPQDNGMILDGWGEACEARRPGFRGAMQFAWEPVSPDATYRWQLMRVGCPYTAQSEVASGATEETGIRIRLAPSRPGEFYLFNLEAERNGRRTGTLMTYGSFGHGWDYRFVVTGR